MASESRERSEIVAELWEVNTPESVEILRQQYFKERDADVRADILSGVVEDPSSETRAGRFAIISAALAPDQPALLRGIAVDLLADYEDPRSVALLQNLLQDGDREIREAAAEAIRARREAEQK